MTLHIQSASLTVTAQTTQKQSAQKQAADFLALLMSAAKGTGGGKASDCGKADIPKAIPAQATEQVAFSANLASIQVAITPAGSYDPANPDKNVASGAVSPHFIRPLSVYDAKGNSNQLNVSFVKTDANTWKVEVFAVPADSVKSARGDGQIAHGTLTFNTDGTLKKVSESLEKPLKIDWTNGSAKSKIDFAWGTPNFSDGMSQFNGDYNVALIRIDGYPKGDLDSVTRDAEGNRTANYTNGVSKTYPPAHGHPRAHHTHRHENDHDHGRNDSHRLHAQRSYTFNNRLSD